jgi:hypothetical protein
MRVITWLINYIHCIRELMHFTRPSAITSSIPLVGADELGGQHCGNTNPITPRGWQQVLGGVKRCRWSRRPPRGSETRRSARLGRKRSWSAPLSPRSGAAMWGTEIGGCTEPKKLQAQLAAHACARLDTSRVGPHWTAARSVEVNSAADACSTLWSAGESLGSSKQ